jgi:hypothetical protein
MTRDRESDERERERELPDSLVYRSFFIVFLRRGGGVTAPQKSRSLCREGRDCPPLL